MAFSEFFCDPVNGANVNGGSDAGSPSMSDTAGTGTYSSVTHHYTSVATNGTVTVGQFISIYSGAATTPAFTSRITTVTGGGGVAWVITCSTTAKSGTEPATGSTYKAQVGGAWLGPNSAVNFPLDVLAAAMTNSAGNKPRVNLKNNGTYSITASILPSSAISNYVRIQGYTSSVGDGGRATIDGGTSGTSYTLLNFSNVGNQCELVDLIFQNNGATGSANGVATTTGGGAAKIRVARCVFHDFRGYGLSFGGGGTGWIVEECEFYNCNQSNTASQGALDLTGGTPAYVHRTIFHDNSGSGSWGARAISFVKFDQCVFDTNGAGGLQATAVNSWVTNCDFYNNGSDGIATATGATAGTLIVENSNFVKNGGWGINVPSTGAASVIIRNCGFGAGTQVNTSGNVSAAGSAAMNIDEIGHVDYASGVTPWVDPANGDFRINLAAAKGVGRGAFTETQASYAGTIGYPDIGAAQHQEMPGGSPIVGSSIVRALP